MNLKVHLRRIYRTFWDFQYPLSHLWAAQSWAQKILLKVLLFSHLSYSLTLVIYCIAVQSWYVKPMLIICHLRMQLENIWLPLKFHKCTRDLQDCKKLQLTNMKSLTPHWMKTSSDTLHMIYNKFGSICHIWRVFCQAPLCVYEFALTILACNMSFAKGKDSTWYLCQMDSEYHDTNVQY